MHIALNNTKRKVANRCFIGGLLIFQHSVINSSRGKDDDVGHLIRPFNAPLSASGDARIRHFCFQCPWWHSDNLFLFRVGFLQRRANAVLLAGEQQPTVVVGRRAAAQTALLRTAPGPPLELLAAAMAVARVTNRLPLTRQQDGHITCTRQNDMHMPSSQ